MSVTELRTWEIRCDGHHCGGASVIVTGKHSPSLPQGWATLRKRSSIGDGPADLYAPAEIRCSYCLSVDPALPREDGTT